MMLTLLSIEQSPLAEAIEPPHYPGQDKDKELYTLLPLVDPAFVEEDVPGDVAQKIATLLHEGETVFVLFRLNSNHQFITETEKPEKAPLWTVITGTRLMLVALASDGRVYADSFDQTTVVEYQNGFGRDALKIADKSLLTGLWEGKRRYFKEAVALFPLPEYEKYLYLADFYLKKHSDCHAIPLLRKSLALVPTLKAYLLLASLLARHDKQDEVFELLKAALQLTDAASLFQEAQLLFPDTPEILFYLAVVCEENHDWDACIDIYHTLLQKNPDFDLYYLKLGEMYNAQQRYELAIEQYQRFIHLRTGSEKFKKGEFLHWDIAELKWFSADPDLVKAYFDLGVIHEYELNEIEKAAALYLALLRHAPFYTDAYKHFWIVFQQLQDHGDTQAAADQKLDISAFLQSYELLVPETYASVVNRPHAAFPSQKGGLCDNPSGSLPIAYHSLDEQEHNILNHAGEQDYYRKIQHWLTNLVIPEEEHQGIEAYCEQVGESNFPSLYRTIHTLADFLNLEPPKCFISRGKIGISIRDKDHPFIFIGSEHLNQENERYFTQDELVFAVATQIEHIKSGHLLITETELWKNLGTVSFDGFLMALQCLPAGSFLGKVTHKFATVGLKKVYKMTRDSGVSKILGLFDRQRTERNAEELADEQEGNGKDAEPDSLLKEQVVDFARYAIYSADRVGLLACNHLGTACSSIFKLAGEAYTELETIQQHGLFQVLGRQDNRGNFLYFEQTKRFCELIRFALSDHYAHLSSTYLVAPKEEPETERVPERDSSEYHLLLNKLQLLEQSMQDDLLSPEEFLRKQKKLLDALPELSDDERQLLDKLQQAFRDEILTVEEFHTKLFRFLRTRQEVKNEESQVEEAL